MMLAHEARARAEARDSLAAYMALLSPTLPQPRHIRELIGALEAVARGELDRVMVFMPPRHEKSVTVSEHFPSWYLGQLPDYRVILASYAAELAYSFSRKARNQLQDPRYPWDLGLREDASTINNWNIADHRGGMIAGGVGGALTGFGANLGIIDDPFKNREDADSQTMRDRCWDWYGSTFYTRLERPNAIVLCMTRWHEDDLAGRLLNASGHLADKWHVIEFPAIDANNLRLWPEQFEYDKIRANIPSRDWNALYQQKPLPDDGDVFKRDWFRYFTASEDRYQLGDKDVQTAACRRFCTVDLALSTKETADFTVIATWAVTPANDLLLLSLIRERMEAVAVVKRLRQVQNDWAPAYMLIERAGYVTAIIDGAKRDGLPVREVVPDKDKRTRALPVAARMEGGTVYFRKDAPWLDEFEDELLAFPNSTHDDQVDTLAYAGLEVVKNTKSANDTLNSMPIYEVH